MKISAPTVFQNTFHIAEVVKIKAMKQPKISDLVSAKILSKEA